jgi:integrase
MPKRSARQSVQCQYFRWLVYSRNGTYYADGRSGNAQDAGRHSLGTDDRREALENLKRLDLVRAVKLGLADQGILNEQPGTLLSLEDGRDRYMAYVGRPAVTGGAGASTVKRYRPVFEKFFAFARSRGVSTWNAVTKSLLIAYGTWLDEEGYAYATEYLELTTLKQAMKWLIDDAKLLPPACSCTLELRKPSGTTAYCYTQEEVSAMVEHCRITPDLSWLGDVIIALAHTGLRIGELSQLRWGDLDEGLTAIRLKDEQRQGTRDRRASGNRTKSHRDRVLPVHQDLRQVLERLPRHKDGRVFHGPRAGVLKPDTVRNGLIRDVITPLSLKFPAERDQCGFVDGRLHSFRHFFCSTCANESIPQQVVQTWLGHADSKMVRHYYHLRDVESRRNMDKIKILTDAARAALVAPGGSAE